MKSILVLAAVLFSVQASATIVVGDMVHYKMTISNAGYSQVMEEKIEVTAINASQGKYTSSVTVTYNGTPISKSSQDFDLNSANESESTLDRCSEISGGMASIETISVIAGTFKVCHISTDQGGVKSDLYMGNVFLGIVKSVTIDSNTSTTSTFELMEFVKH